MDEIQTKEIYEASTRHFLGPILPLLDDPDVSEVLINGPHQVYYEKKGKLQLSQIKFPNESSLLAAANNVAEYVNRTLDIDNHSMDARLPDGLSVSNEDESHETIHDPSVRPVGGRVNRKRAPRPRRGLPIHEAHR